MLTLICFVALGVQTPVSPFLAVPGVLKNLFRWQQPTSKAGAWPLTIFMLFCVESSRKMSGGPQSPGGHVCWVKVARKRNILANWVEGGLRGGLEG